MLDRTASIGELFVVPQATWGTPACTGACPLSVCAAGQGGGCKALSVLLRGLTARQCSVRFFEATEERERMKSMKIIALSAAALALTAVNAVAQTWICDSKAVVGFDRERGYDVTTYSANRSYRIEADIAISDLSTGVLRNYEIFERKSDNFMPASIQRLGDDFVGLCVKVSLPSSEWINCDGFLPFGTRFNFRLETGLFSMLAGGYESGGKSWVEVGECRRIN
ncbi:hypothetical protein [Salibaculum halophilum]|uniref:hypothetical protein n=1 Tax=Salibaculum halophilum TaxID=1914408 RepID=UPI00117A540B|nr:hypothetical protein [Salibaculum halophilum]